MNKQREVIYNQRRTLLAENNLRPLIFGMLNDVVHECVSAYAAEKTYPEEWDWDGFDRRLFDLFGFGHGVPMKQRPQAKPEDLERLIITRYKEIYEQKVSEVNDQVFREVERFVGLRVVDGYWKEQLHNMDHLREGIGLRAVGQKDPFVEYQIEAFDMFHEMIAQIREDIVRYLLRIRLVPEGVNHRHLPAVQFSLHRFEPIKFNRWKTKNQTLQKKEKLVVMIPVRVGVGKSISIVVENKLGF